MISRLYNERVDTKRLATVLDEEDEPTNKKDFSTNLENVSCYIQALDDDISKDATSGFGKEWRVFCDVVDILEGDRIIQDPDGTPIEYHVIATKTFNGHEVNRHMELRIRAFKS